MKLKIIKDSNPIMRQKSNEVSLPLSKEDKELLDAMSNYLELSQDEEYARKHNIRAGVGLAAIQVGVLKRMYCIHIQDEDKLIRYQLVNPKIVETSAKHAALESGEGCLSVEDEHQGLVHRYYKVVIDAYDAIQDKNIQIVARGFEAIVLQHEYDHLEGRFFYDRIDKNKPNTPLSGEILL